MVSRSEALGVLRQDAPTPPTPPSRHPAAMPARGLDRDETVGSHLLLAVPRHERDIQVMCRGSASRRST